ncbi:MAG: transposase [Candidatus Aminicenantes bacterium]|nr:transposase [Candidatus Aminicenantes bacterium]
MRRARITYKGAFHHAMNRGHEGKKIFLKDSEKNLFLELLKETAKGYRIRIFTYCIMDNHYHLVLENSSGRMSEFFKKLNGQYGRIYRRENKGKGYVFQDRFKSKIIQDDSYLIMVMGYVLNNPVRAGLVTDFLDYQWSSSSLYFKEDTSDIVDNKYVEALYGSFYNMSDQIRNLTIKELPVILTRVGEIIGGEEFVVESLEKFNRRKPNDQVEEYKRIDDYYFDSVEKVFYEFKKIHKINVFDIDTKSYKGKRLRGELLVYLKDNAGLTYGEIKKVPIFSDLKISSLGWIYKNAKIRLKN